MDMQLADGNGIDAIGELKAKGPGARGIILPGYGNIVTAVTAVKLGAFDYLAKPVDAEEIFNALMATRHDKAELPENPMSADRVRWDEPLDINLLAVQGEPSATRASTSKYPKRRASRGRRSGRARLSGSPPEH